ncbi:hypothetical protein [Streptomyces sp. NPDC047061]|uniref:hypothetical protein n=1 Tax=Streptomyces sp. NPDC047061 TaxID=3154605 RepID=UPI0033FBB451
MTTLLIEGIHKGTKLIKDGNKAPFTWTTQVNAPEDAPCRGGAVVIPNAHASLPSWDNWDAWVKREGGAHADRVVIRVTLQGKSTNSVVVHALRVGVDSRSAPRGAAYVPGGGCGGLTPRLFEVDLDDPKLTVVTKAGEDGTPAVKFPYVISSTEPEVLLVSAETDTCDCTFHLDLDWTSGDRGGTVRINEGKNPFRVVGTEKLPTHVL